MSPHARVLVGFTLALGAGSCAGLQLPGGLGQVVKPLLPNITLADVRLVDAPSNRTLAAALCARVAPAPVCGIIGPVPRPDQIHFGFETHLDASNPNAFPLPVVEALTAFTAYPQAQGQANLGAVCLSFCEDPAHCPQNSAGACQSPEPTVKDADDYAGAVAGLLIGVLTGQVGLENLKVRTIPPSASTRMVVHLELGAEPVLGLMKTFAGQAIDDLKRGRIPQLSIPYKTEGSLFMNVERFGRLAAPFGPREGAFALR